MTKRQFLKEMRKYKWSKIGSPFTSRIRSVDNIYFCPLTYICFRLKGKHYWLEQASNAAKDLNISYKDAVSIVQAADGIYSRSLRERFFQYRFRKAAGV